MPDKSGRGIDRRELIMGSIATVGAAAAIAANAGSVKAEAASSRLFSTCSLDQGASDLSAVFDS